MSRWCLCFGGQTTATTSTRSRLPDPGQEEGQRVGGLTLKGRRDRSCWQLLEKTKIQSVSVIKQWSNRVTIDCICTGS